MQSTSHSPPHLVAVVSLKTFSRVQSQTPTMLGNALGYMLRSIKSIYLLYYKTLGIQAISSESKVRHELLAYRRL